MRWEGETGVVGSEEELVDADDVDETETERRLLWLAMGMGMGLSFEDIWK